MLIAAANNNFLLPNATLLVELVAFGIILGILWKFVVEPVQRVLQERQEMIRTQQHDAREAERRMQQAESDYRRSLDEARAEAARIREEARAQGQEIIDEARREAQAESDRVIAQGREQLGAERDGIVREIRASIGSLAVDLAGRMVGEPIGDDTHWRGTVEPFLSSIDTVDGRLQAGQVPEPPAVPSGERA